MVIKNLTLINFRNYKKIKIDLNSGINIFIGNNAQGKTNILESIFVLAFTKSYLNIKDFNLIKKNEDFFKIQAQCVSNYDDKYEVSFVNNCKKVKINNNEISKLCNYIEKIKVILFSPYNVNFVKDGPSIRRKEINMSISQLDGYYVKILQEYNAILKKRNQFLKSNLLSNEYNNSYFENLTLRLVFLASEIIEKRKKFIDDINENISSIFDDIMGYQNLKLEYLNEFCDFSKDEIKKKLYEKYINLKDREKNYGATLIGPHRDDFAFYLDGNELSIYGSQGQIRAAILSLKLAELSIVNKVSCDNPILLLDDIFSELDLEKRNKILKYLKNDVQTIITTTDLNLIDSDLIMNSKIFNVNDGKIVSFERECNYE